VAGINNNIFINDNKDGFVQTPWVMNMPFSINKLCVALVLTTTCFSASATISIQQGSIAPRQEKLQNKICSYTDYLGRWESLLSGSHSNSDGIVITESSLEFDNGVLIPHSVLSTRAPIVFRPQLDNVASPTVFLLYAEECNSNRMCLSEHHGSTAAATDSEPTAMRCYARPNNAAAQQ